MLVFNHQFIFYRVFSLIIILLSSAPQITYSQSSPSLVSKRGGICFRTDDNQLLSRYLEYDALFNKYNQKFTFAINLGKSKITSNYINVIKQMQASGHEMMDHTPTHGTNFFTTFLDTSYYSQHPGVHQIYSNSAIKLKYSPVDILNAKRKGYVNISKDTITSTNGVFSGFSKGEDFYLYFPTLDKLVLIDPTNGWIDQNTVWVKDFWKGWVDLGTHQNIRFYNFDYYNVHLTIEGLRALAEETLRLINYYNLERPYTWIQPGGYCLQVHNSEVKQAMAELGYKSAGTSIGSLKVFNEYNPNNDKQFGMHLGDFRQDTWDLNTCKQKIADRIAKHHVLIGSSHFNRSELLGGWSVILAMTEKLIQWCIANDIPIRTYSEWGDILYNQIPNPNENIFPPLNVDLDANSI